MKYRVAGAICDTEARDSDGFRETVRADDATVICDCGATTDYCGDAFASTLQREAHRRWVKKHRPHVAKHRR